MRRNALHRFFRKPLYVVPAAIFLVVTIDLLWFGLKFPSGMNIYTTQTLPTTGRPALVLGAGVKTNGEPTQVLEGRLQIALKLNDEKKTSWILVSGDNRTHSYNEPQAMRRWLIKSGVPPEKIVSDYAGRRTYDTLKRAKQIFGLDSLIIVTSDFHMPRTLYLAKSLGLDAQGVPSDTKSIGTAAHAKFWLREYTARHKAVWDTWFPPSTMMGPEEDTPDRTVAGE